jgi:hypothetical protein
LGSGQFGGIDVSPSARRKGAAAMHIQDQFISDPELLDLLAQEKTWAELKGLNWWDGWWRGEPRNLWERVIELIWRPQGVEGQIAGFEYWGNVFDAKTRSFLPWHADKDEVLLRRSGKMVGPMVGTIYYGFPHDPVGGYLEIAREESQTEVERIAPVFNRLIIFDAHVPHRVTRIYGGLRYGFQVNLWKTKPETFADKDAAVDIQSY